MYDINVNKFLKNLFKLTINNIFKILLLNWSYSISLNILAEFKTLPNYSKVIFYWLLESTSAKIATNFSSNFLTKIFSELALIFLLSIWS
jgi:hypothetical protein